MHTVTLTVKEWKISCRLYSFPLFMYRRRILCTLYGVVDFLNCSEDFWAQMALAALIAISGPKKVSTLGPTPYNGPRNGYCPPQNHYVPRDNNNRYINSFYNTIQVWQNKVVPHARLYPPPFPKACLGIIICNNYDNINTCFSSAAFYLWRFGSQVGSYPLSPLLWIISKRRYILAAQLLLREKSGT